MNASQDDAEVPEPADAPPPDVEAPRSGRALPPDANVAPITRRRNVEVIGWLVAAAAFLVLLKVTNRVVHPVVLTVVGVAVAATVLGTVRDLRRLLRSSAPRVGEEPVEVVGRSRAGVGAMLLGEPGVDLRDAEGEFSYQVVADRRELRGVPVGTEGVRHEYEDGIAVVVVGDRTLWCKPAKK